MKLVRSLALVAAVAALPLAAACGGTVENPQTSASAMTKAPVGAGTHGMVKVIGDAFGEVPLRPEQRTEIEKMAEAAETRHAPTAAGRKELMLAVADQIEKGAIDRAALQPKIDRVTADFEQVRTEDRAALGRLHALLDADQRGAFVDAVEKQMKAKRGEHGPKAAFHGFARMKQLSEDLKLTDEQRKQIKDALRELHESAKGDHHGRGARHHGKEHGMHGRKRMLESFREDTWKPEEASGGDVKSKVAKGSTRIIGVAEKILPILTPEQRKIAADKIRETANSGKHMLLAP